MTFTVLCRDRRKMQISSIGWWESWSRSQSISRRRVWSHMGEALSGLMPWRHTFHAIEGKAVLKFRLEIHLVSCYTLWPLKNADTLFLQASLESAWSPTLFSSDTWFSWTSFTALWRGVSSWGPLHFMAGETTVVSKLLLTDCCHWNTPQSSVMQTSCLCDLTETLQFGGNDSVLDFFLGTVRLLLPCWVLFLLTLSLMLSCNLSVAGLPESFSSFLWLLHPWLPLSEVSEHAPVVPVRHPHHHPPQPRHGGPQVGHYKPAGQWNRFARLFSSPLNLWNGFDRTVVGYKHTWMLGRRYTMNVSFKIFCGWDFTIQDPESAALKHSFIRNDLRVSMCETKLSKNYYSKCFQWKWSLGISQRSCPVSPPRPQLFLEEQNFSLRVAQRTLGQRVRLYLLRFVLNLLVVSLLTGAIYLIFYATEKSQHEVKQNPDAQRPAVFLWVDFLPLCLLERPPLLVGQADPPVPSSHHHQPRQPVPALRLPQDLVFWRLLFHHAGQCHACEVRHTHSHSHSPCPQGKYIDTYLYTHAHTLILVFLQEHLFEAGLTGVLLSFHLPNKRQSTGEWRGNDVSVGLNKTKIIQIAVFQCWENRLGSEMYKLCIFNFLAIFCSAFLLNYPRKWVCFRSTVAHLINKKVHFYSRSNFPLSERLIQDKYPRSLLARLLGKQYFLIPFNVLDLVYSQTVSWIGVYYCPLLPMIGTVTLIATLYIKKVFSSFFSHHFTFCTRESFSLWNNFNMTLRIYTLFDKLIR